MNIQKEMHKIVYLVTLPCLLWTAISCSDDTYRTDNDVDTAQQNPYATVCLSLELPSSGQPSTDSDLKTRVTGTYDGELYIETIDVLAFDPDDKTLLFRIEADSIITDENDKTITTCRAIMKRGTYDLMVLINANTEIVAAYSDLTEADGYTLEDVRKDIVIHSANPWNATYGTSGYTPIPMWGMNENIAVDGETFVQGSNIFKMTRMLARIDLSLSVQAQENFNITAIHLYNYNDYGQLVPDEGTMENGYAIVPSIPPAATLTLGPYEYRGTDYITENGTVCTGVIYAFEAIQGTRENYLDNTCLVIEGEYKGEAGHYYRMDFTTKAEDGKTVWLDILRNHIYNVTITKVDGPGYRDKEDAYKSLPENIETEIIQWDASEMTNIIFDGQYYISTSANPVLLQGMAGSDALQLETDCPGWKYVLSGNADPEATATAPGWITITSGHSQNTEYSTSSADLTFTFEQNGTGAIRDAYIHIWAGRFVVTVTIRQNPWYIGRVAITPDEITAASGGAQYTITIEGFYDDTTPIPVRLCNADGTVIDSNSIYGTTSGDVTSGSGILDLPAYWLTAAGSRQLVFEYENPIDGEWTQILAPQQAAYWIDISASNPDMNDFTGWGSYMDITVKGNYPSLPIRFSNTTGTAAVTTGDQKNLPETVNDLAGKTYRVYVPYNDEGNPDYRTIQFQYWDGTYNQSNQEAWTSAFSIIQRQGNIVLAEYDWEEYSAAFDGTKTGWLLGVSPAHNRVLAHQDYDHLMGGVSLVENWYEAMGLEPPQGMDSSTAGNTPYPDGTTSTTGSTTPAYGIGTADDQYLVSNYTPEVATGCGAYYERDYNKVTDWMLPTVLEANQIKYMYASLQRPAGFSNLEQPGLGGYSSIYVSTELSECYFFDDIGPSSTGSIYSNIWSEIYPRYLQTPSSPQYTVDLHKTTTMVVLVNNGPVTGLDINGYYMYYCRKNGSMKTTSQTQYINTRCVRQWDPATDVGGPGYTPTFGW
ncbi:MAG: hypothetical protein LIP06_11885 [Tannerellaceae bacterium]|nr:hypothetical protein [Tannerellaceae bacterium]